MTCTCKSIACSVRLITQKNKNGTTMSAGWAAAWTDDRGTVKYDTMKELLDDLWWWTSMEGVYQKIEGETTSHTAVVVGCDLAYTLAAGWQDIVAAFHVKPLAKGPGDIYALMCHNDTQKLPVVTFWDLRHMQIGGIDGMARMLGRTTPSAPADAAELMLDYVSAMATRHGLTLDEMGTRVLTLTGCARHDAAASVGCLTFEEGKGRKSRDVTLLNAYRQRATIEAAQDYRQYALRKACNRGGLTFTAARHAGVVHGRTIAIDEASAHHAQAICRYVPERFHTATPTALTIAARRIAAMTIDDVLAAYHMPFTYCFHACFRFTGVKLKAGTLWEHEEIGTHGMARLAPSSGIKGVDDDAVVEAERALRAAGYGDKAEGGVYAFGKLMAADVLTTFMTEGELFLFTHTYDYDDVEGIWGEAATKSRRPEDYSILTSMHFYAQKQAQKRAIQAGRHDLEEVYKLETKPAYNAVGYGLHARDELRPGYEIDDDGTWHMEPPVTEDDYDARRPKISKAWYTYGIRISIGARLHLFIAAELIWNRFHDAVGIAAGDTDSLKLVVGDGDVTVDDVLDALTPLHEATRRAIDLTTSRARRLFPKAYDPMYGVGEFEPDGGRGGEFAAFYAPGVKQYLTISYDGAVDLTLAGVPRAGDDSYAAWLKLFIDKYSPAVLPMVFGFDVTLDPSVSQLVVPDYAGAYRAGELPLMRGASYTLNDTSSPEAQATIAWQRDHGRVVDDDPQATASWDPAGAVFYYSYGRLQA